MSASVAPGRVEQALLRPDHLRSWWQRRLVARAVADEAGGWQRRHTVPGCQVRRYSPERLASTREAVLADRALCARLDGLWPGLVDDLHALASDDALAVLLEQVRMVEDWAAEDRLAGIALRGHEVASKRAFRRASSR